MYRNFLSKCMKLIRKDLGIALQRNYLCILKFDFIQIIKFDIKKLKGKFFMSIDMEFRKKSSKNLSFQGIKNQCTDQFVIQFKRLKSKIGKISQKLTRI